MFGGAEEAASGTAEPSEPSAIGGAVEQLQQLFKPAPTAEEPEKDEQKPALPDPLKALMGLSGG